MEKCLYLVLRMVRELAGAPVPSPVLQALEPADFETRWLALATERILAGAGGVTSSALTAPVPLRAMADLSTPGFCAAKYGAWWRALFPPREYMEYYMAAQHALPLTPWRAYTCYFTRAMDWLSKGLHLACYGAVHRRQAVRDFRTQRQQNLLRQWLGSSGARPWEKD
jgi:hypothetical protein